jgi:hypothetical protein
VVVTTLIVLARSVGKRVALIFLPVSAQCAAAWEENTIRSAFALNVAGRVSHSQDQYLKGISHGLGVPNQWGLFSVALT